MRSLEELINLPRTEWTEEEQKVLSKFQMPWAIKFKCQWEETCKHLNKERTPQHD